MSGHGRMHGRGAHITIGLMLAGAMALAACGSASSSAGGSATSSGSAASSAGGFKIAFVTKPIDNVYFGSMVTGGQDAAKALGVDITVAAAQNVSDDSGQASKLSALVSSGYSCFVLNPTSPTNLITPMSKAKNATIINIDLVMDTAAAKAQGVTVNTYLGTVNEQAGAAGGKAMLALLPEGSKVAIIGTLAQDAGNIARQAGFKDATKGKLDIIQTVSADADRVKAKNSAAAIMRAHPDVTGFFTPAGTQAMGIQEAIDQAGKAATVKVVGIDGTKEELESIVKGELASTVEQFPYLMGYQAVQACVAARDGKTLPTKVDTPVLIVDKTNAQAALDASPAPPKGFDVPNPFAG